MLYQEFNPPIALQDVVKCFWVLEDNGRHHPTEQVLPDGCIELIVHYRDLFERGDRKDLELNSQVRGFVFGQITKALLLKPLGQIGMIGVRFQSHGLSHFTNVPAFHLAEKSVPLVELFGREGDMLVEQICMAKTIPAKVDVLAAFLIEHRKFLGKVTPLVMGFLQALKTMNGEVKLKELAKQLGVSERQLERRFKLEVGISPKKMASIIRFKHALYHLQNSRNLTLTEIAHNVGYYDQAHFNRDFKDITGLVPKQFFKEDQAMMKIFVNAT